MNVLVVSQYYYPEEFKINDICEQLKKNGHNVTVLTGLPNYPVGRIPKEYKNWKKRKEEINGVNVIRCYEIPRKNNVIGLAFNYISYAISASIRTLFLKKDFDIIFIYQLSPVFMSIPAIIYKKITKKPLLLYCLDLWPESIKSIINREDSFIYKIVKKVSSYIYDNSDHIAVTSKPFIEYIRNLNKDTSVDKFTYLPQHAEDSYRNMDLTSVQKKHINFMFLGNVGIAQDIDCIIDAVELIKENPNFQVHIVGDGSYLNESKNIIREKGLEKKVLFHGRHPVEKMPEFYKMADACLLTLKYENYTGMTIPSKLQGYMAAGKPVIAAINGASQDIIRDAECGLCVNASDSLGLAKIMLEFINNKDKYIECGEKGKKYFEENFTQDIYINSLEKIIEKMVVQNRDV